MQKLSELLNSSKKVLVISHHSPDLDAIISTILCYKILKENFPSLKISANIEKLNPKSFYSYFEGFAMISNYDLIESVKIEDPDLIIMLDGTGYSRFTRGDTDQLKSLIEQNKIKTVVIDHHEILDYEKEGFDLYINSYQSSCCEEVYKTFIKKEELKIFAGFEKYLLAGIYSDTSGFQYGTNKETLELVGDLLDQDKNLGSIKNLVIHYTPGMVSLISEFLKNMRYENGYNYSFLSVEYFEQNVSEKLTEEEYKLGTRYFADDYLYSVGKNKFGFLIAPSYYFKTKKTFKGSLRCLTGTFDCRIFAYKMNGGGYKDGGGFEIFQDNLDSALKDTVKIIEQNFNSAIKALK